MKYLTLQHLIQIHVLVLKETGGGKGLRDLSRLESVVASQVQRVFGEELYKTAYEKSAAIMRGIVSDHPFIDGNKRTAMLAGLTFLELNGYVFQASNSELEDYAVRIATDKLDVPAIAEWLKHHAAQH